MLTMLRRNTPESGEVKPAASHGTRPTLGGFARSLLSRASHKKQQDEDGSIECDISPNSIQKLMFFGNGPKVTGHQEPVKENQPPDSVETEEKPAVSISTRDNGTHKNVHFATDVPYVKPVLGVSGQISTAPGSFRSFKIQSLPSDHAAFVDPADAPTVLMPGQHNGTNDTAHCSAKTAILPNIGEGEVRKQGVSDVGGSRASHEANASRKSPASADSGIVSSVLAMSISEAMDLSVGSTNRRSSNLAVSKEPSNSPNGPRNAHVVETRKTPRSNDILKTAKSESCISIHPSYGEHKTHKRSPPLVLQGEPESEFKCAVRISGNPTPRRSEMSAFSVNAKTATVPPRPLISVPRSAHHFASLRGIPKGIDAEALKEAGDTPSNLSTKRRRASKVTASDWDVETDGVQQKKYMIIRQLGKGGSGEVYLVVEKETKNLFALKRVNLSGVNSSVLAECVNEIEMLVGLKDTDFVVRIDAWEINRVQKTMKIVMEYGQCDLAASLRSSKFTLREVQSTWERMLKIVKKIHERGIVHADLKPSNFVWVGHKLKIIDFGIASRLQNDITSIAMLNPKGTLNYISPETIVPDISGKTKVGTKSDIWSLGCILYLMIYGKTPFQDFEHYASKISAISKGNVSYPPLPREFEGSKVESVLQMCFRMDHRKRPSAADLLQHPFLTNMPLIMPSN